LAFTLQQIAYHLPPASSISLEFIDVTGEHSTRYPRPAARSWRVEHFRTQLLHLLARDRMHFEFRNAVFTLAFTC
jgi:hypothetical protein